jgi:ADP-heptose:LPS heptosyltransferase
VYLSIRAPDHLGDGVMALPAIAALGRAYEVQIHAPRWGVELYQGFSVVPAEAPAVGEVGVLLKPSWGAAWRWRHLRRRVGLSVNHRGWLLSDPVVAPPGHRREAFAAVAGVLGARVEGLPQYLPRGQPRELPSNYVGLNPWSPSPTVRWPFFRQLAQRLREQGEVVVFFCGPGEAAAVAPMAEGFPLVAGLKLPDFAATLQACRLFVSNDSGAAHFAAACGVRVRMIHGSTTASLTGVGEGIEAEHLWCQPCYRKSCPIGVRCITRVGVEDVLR